MLSLDLVKPLHIAEVLTMRQVGVLGVHAHARAVRASHVGLYNDLERIEVAILNGYTL